MKKGMNPEAVEAIAGDIDELIESMNSIYEGRLGYATDLDWTGEDRDKYLSEFESTVGAANKAVVSQLTEFAERLRTNAQAQRETSGR
ncbi:hypothetical protein V1260_01795 [Brachybacterium sp. J144]|uniref:WXG100 family type VII secretion target n=1 Tax=Brachybacterium sp. J144 TaxID=3116487 RepID=UPI002E76D518|nr:hypothetical protein [Brachybacterium sp. J144]MEE1649519.1 hypothetical protein [Brachybacterium sp. J144]